MSERRIIQNMLIGDPGWQQTNDKPVGPSFIRNDQRNAVTVAFMM